MTARPAMGDELAGPGMAGLMSRSAVRRSLEVVDVSTSHDDRWPLALSVCFMIVGFSVRGFGEPLVRLETLVPLVGQLRHGEGCVVEPLRDDAKANLASLLLTADRPSLLEHHQMLDDGLATERHVLGQRARRGRTALDEQIDDPSA